MRMETESGAVSPEPEAEEPESEAKEDAGGSQQHQTSSAAALQQHLPSSSRIMRNLAEKMRRDKLNMYINELATLVPMVASSTKRMDKTSILRLSATFLRMHRTLNSTDLQMQLLPSYLELANVSQQMLENMEGFMLIVTSSGKIVFISEMVEKLLGHTQMDLMGQSIYGITHPDDHEEMKRNLALNEDSSDSSFTDSQSGEDSSSEDASTSTQSEASPRPSYPPSSGVPPPDSSQVNQRRSFYVRLAERAVSRGDPSRYELIHMVGHLRSPQQPEASPSTQSRRRQREPASTVNDYVLVAVARHVRDHRVTELSLMEAVKDEYVTRHLLDGRIIFVDHRISVVAGYLTEEVSGMSAFTFMHQEDSRWTMIALRQMYGSPEGCGSSVYRLLAKNGQFIYLRTHGYLEFDKNTQKVESFICVNTLISDEEGAQGILDMKERYSPTGSAQTPALMPNDADAEETDAEKPPEEVKATNNNVSDDNPSVEQLVEQILSPVCIEERCSPSPLPDTQYVKAALYGKSLPPASLQASKVGIPIQAQQLKGQAVSPKPASPDTIGSSVQQAVVVQDNVCKKSKQTVDTGVVDSAMQEVVLNRPMVPESLSSVQVNKVMVAYTATSFGGNTSVQTHVITQSPPGPEGVGLHVQMATSQQHINKGMVLSPNSLAALVPNSSNCTNVSSSHMFSQPPEGHIQIAHKPQEYKIKDSMKETVQRNAIYTCMSSPGQCVEYNLVQNVGAEVPTVQLKNAVTERRTVHQHVLKRPLSDPSMLENVKRLHTSRTERNISRVYTETDSNILSAEVQTSDGCSDLVNFLQTDRNLSNVDVPSANLLSEALFPPEKETDLKCETSATSFAVPEPSNNEETDSWLGALISPDQTEIQADGDNVDTDFSNFDLTDMQGDSKEFIDLFDIADAPKQNLPQNITSSFEDQNGEFELSKVERIYRLKGDQVWEETPETILQPTGVQSPPRQQETLDFEQQLIRRHVQLESRMQLQENQINTIEQDLHQVPLQNIGGEIYRSNLSHIRAKHKEQTQMLKNLRQEHQNMHKDKLKLCGNVGV